MKRLGIINSHISKILADLGHTDFIVIADVGLPIPNGVPKIDLALALGTPSFQAVVNAVAEDMVIEKIIIANEITDNNQATQFFLQEKFSDICMEKISHEQLKKLTQHAKVIIRTGEATPYANCILQSGVNFG